MPGPKRQPIEVRFAAYLVKAGDGNWERLPPPCRCREGHTLAPATHETAWGYPLTAARR